MRHDFFYNNDDLLRALVDLITSESEADAHFPTLGRAAWGAAAPCETANTAQKKSIMFCPHAATGPFAAISLRPGRLRTRGESVRIFINDKGDEWDDSGSRGGGKEDATGRCYRT